MQGKMTLEDSRLIKIFEIMSFFDHFRWSHEQNYNLINFCDHTLDYDTKLLTHWLCYITDRQMPFKIIWDVGGFVISEIISEIKDKRDFSLINPNNQNSFIDKEKDTNGKIKYYFYSKRKANDFINTNYPQYIKDGRVRFKSRFFPSDYFAILYTLIFLQDYEFKFSRFIKEIYNQYKDKADLIKRALFCLYLVTYYDVGQPDSQKIGDFDKNFLEAKERKNYIKDLFNDNNRFEKEYNKFCNTQIFKQKRAWCSSRDFLKSPEFKGYFRNALTEEGLVDQDFNKLFSFQSLVQIELPGDVWNNNAKFRKCILKGTRYENDKRPLNMILREFFDRNSSNIQNAYPEQFDVTFDFVPRMCEQNNCSICPIFKEENKNNNDFNKVCLENRHKYCPVALIGCNYKHNCIGKQKCNIA